MIIGPASSGYKNHTSTDTLLMPVFFFEPTGGGGVRAITNTNPSEREITYVRLPPSWVTKKSWFDLEAVAMMPLSNTACECVL